MANYIQNLGIAAVVAAGLALSPARATPIQPHQCNPPASIQLPTEVIVEKDRIVRNYITGYASPLGMIETIVKGQEIIPLEKKTTPADALYHYFFEPGKIVRQKLKRDQVEEHILKLLDEGYEKARGEYAGRCEPIV
ncbi:MAG TPA: hypothetical protein VJB12_05895 [Candidatus Nanoarchaeia archaeon]|nr:hypothetical protein [Candidatus Nanoarchaeia archaeon]